MTPRQLCSNLFHDLAIGKGIRPRPHIFEVARGKKPVISGRSRFRSAESRSTILPDKRRYAGDRFYRGQYSNRAGSTPR